MRNGNEDDGIGIKKFGVFLAFVGIIIIVSQLFWHLAGSIGTYTAIAGMVLVIGFMMISLGHVVQVRGW